MENKKKVELDSYLAVGIAEGFEEADSPQQYFEAWAYLIRTKLCYQLQGFFGRTARGFIDGGLISEDGVLNQEAVDEYVASFPESED